MTLYLQGPRPLSWGLDLYEADAGFRQHYQSVGHSIGAG
jgi:hypothetical protein